MQEVESTLLDFGLTHTETERVLMMVADEISLVTVQGNKVWLTLPKSDKSALLAIDDYNAIDLQTREKVLRRRIRLKIIGGKNSFGFKGKAAEKAKIIIIRDEALAK